MISKTFLRRSLILFALCCFAKTGETKGQTTYLRFGNFDTWLVRNIKESRIIGGNTKTLYEVGPNDTWNNDTAYPIGHGGSPWATSNVMAKVCGITKTNTSVYRERRGSGYCARLETHIEKCVVMGIVNIKVLAAGSVWLGGVLEPITSTSCPMGKLVAGMPFNKRPKSIMFDYKVKLSGEPNRVRETGFSKVTTVAGLDMPDCLLLLQKRWEDSKGNLYAKRVGTMVVRFGRSTGDWVDNAQFPIHYGNITGQSYYQSYMGLISGDATKYGLNSRGKNVPIHEVGWASPSDSITHIVLQFDSSHGGAYVGSIGNTFWVDNVRLIY
jgi:hypothetical protein